MREGSRFESTHRPFLFFTVIFVGLGLGLGLGCFVGIQDSSYTVAVSGCDSCSGEHCNCDRSLSVNSSIKRQGNRHRLLRREKRRFMKMMHRTKHNMRNAIQSSRQNVDHYACNRGLWALY